MMTGLVVLIFIGLLVGVTVFGSFKNVLFSVKEVGAIPFVIFLIIIQFFLLINIQSFVPASQVDKYRTAIMSYMILTIFFVGFTEKKDMFRGENLPFFSDTLVKGVTKFLFGFLVIWVVFGAFMNPSHASGDKIGSEFIFFTLIVAVSEELIFRYGLPRYFYVFMRGNNVTSPKGVESGTAMVLSNVFFAIFHSTVYHFDPSSIMYAFIAGLLLYAVASKFGIEYSMGAHASYNLIVGGVI